MHYRSLNHTITVGQHVRMVAIVMIFSLLACEPASRPPQNRQSADSSSAPNASYLRAVDSITNLAETGDIITRTGNDFTSQSLRTLNRRSKLFSHCGLIRIENKEPVVYHILGGEWNPDQKILRQSVAAFCNPTENKGVGLFRLTADTSTKAKFLERLLVFQRQPVSFDMAFDLQTDDRLYCAELIAKSIEQADGSSFQFNRSRLGDKLFIGVDDLFLAPFVKPVFQLFY